ncbi:MAG TPA: PAS domain-containing protein [Acidimicrobiales bacterium]|nr:PAS domain-containing protein [Acidimicrobiales bacterium]
MVTLGALAAVVILGVAQVMGDLLGISLFRRDSFHDWLLFAWLTVILIAAARLGVYVRRLWETVSTREEQLAAVEATSSDWMWEARVTRRPTLELTFTSCSPSVVGLLGWRPQDVVGRPMLELVCPEHVGPARAVIADAVDKGAGWSGVELCWRHADGVPFGCSATPCPSWTPRVRSSGSGAADGWPRPTSTCSAGWPGSATGWTRCWPPIRWR